MMMLPSIILGFVSELYIIIQLFCNTIDWLIFIVRLIYIEMSKEYNIYTFAYTYTN